MRIANGRIRAGRVELDDSPFIDGTEVIVISREPATVATLDADELAELGAGVAEADSGQMISGNELFERLRRHG